jgi:hypothetical protein
LRNQLGQDEKAKSDLVAALAKAESASSKAESASAKAQSALAEANLEIGSLKTTPGGLPAGAQLLHGHTY